MNGAPPPDEEIVGSADERLASKKWKWRVSGCELVRDEFAAGNFEHAHLLKQMVSDKNAMALEAGLNALLAFATHAPHPEGHFEEIAAPVLKAFSGRPSAKAVASDCFMMFIERGAGSEVAQALIECAATNKVPKVRVASAECLLEAVRAFGVGKRIPPKPLIGRLPKVFEDTNGGVRQSAHDIAVEMYKWVGAAADSTLKDLRGAQRTELEKAYAEVTVGSGTATRLLRSEQAAAAAPPSAAPAAAAAAAGGDGTVGVAGGDDESEAEAAGGMAAYDVAEPVAALQKLPASFYGNVASSKWKERKEALEELHKVVSSSARLDTSDNYGDAVCALHKVISKDANVMCVAKAAECVACMAGGLCADFQPHVSMLLPALLAKLKEKKALVVTAIQAALLAMYPYSVTMGDAQEALAKALKQANPKEKQEALNWVAECARMKVRAARADMASSASTLVPMLVKALDDGSADVRKAATNACAAVGDVIGKSAMTGYLKNTDKLKSDKVLEAITEKAPKRAAAAPAAVAPVAAAAPAAAPPAAKPAAAAAARPAAKPVPAKPAPSPAPVEPTPAEPERPATRAGWKSVMSASLTGKLASSSWKERGAALDAIAKALQNAALTTDDLDELASAIKQRLKDSNMKLQARAVECVALLAPAVGPAIDRFSMSLLDPTLSMLTDKKSAMRTAALAALTAWSDATGVDACIKSLGQAMKVDHSQLRLALLPWVVDHAHELSDGADLHAWVRPVLSALEDRNSQVRALAKSLVSVLIKRIGSDALLRECSNMKRSSQLVVKPIIEACAGGGGGGSGAATAAPAAAAAAASTRSAAPAASSKRATQQRRASPAAAAAAAPAADGPIRPNAHKATRERYFLAAEWRLAPQCESIDERQMQTLREELSESYSDAVVALMFEADPLKSGALRQLNALSQKHLKETTQCLDVLFKWLVWRTMHKSGTVVEKVLQFTSLLFDRLAKADYYMTPMEASILVPRLVAMLGATAAKAAERASALLDRVPELFPASQAFELVLECGVCDADAPPAVQCGALVWCTAVVHRQTANVCDVKAVVPAAARLATGGAGVVRKAATKLLAEVYLHVGKRLYAALDDAQASQCRALLKQAGATVAAGATSTSPSRLTSSATERAAAKHPGDFVIVSGDDEFATSHESGSAAASEAGASSSAPAPASSPEAWIDGIRRGSPTMVVEQIKHLCLVLGGDDYVSMYRYVDGVVTALSSRLPDARDMLDDPQGARFYKYLLNGMQSLFRWTSLAVVVSRSALQCALEQLLRGLLDSALDYHAEGIYVYSALNELTFSILTHSDRSTVVAVLVRFLRESARDDGERYPSKFTETVVKCLLKVTKLLEEAAERVSSDTILQEVHEFFEAHPPGSFSGRDSFAEKAIKTTLSELVRVKGPAILQQIPFAIRSMQPAPRLVVYVNVLLDPNGSLSASSTPSASSSELPAVVHIAPFEDDDSSGAADVPSPAPASAVRTRSPLVATATAAAEVPAPSASHDAATTATRHENTDGYLEKLRELQNRYGLRKENRSAPPVSLGSSASDAVAKPLRAVDANKSTAAPLSSASSSASSDAAGECAPPPSTAAAVPVASCDATSNSIADLRERLRRLKAQL